MYQLFEAWISSERMQVGVLLGPFACLLGIELDRPPERCDRLLGVPGQRLVWT
jgi:hypothetical protein